MQAQLSHGWLGLYWVECVLKRVIFLAMFSSVPLAFISLVKEVPSKGAPGLGQPSLKSACISSLHFSYVWVGADMPGVAIPPGGWWSLAPPL